MSKSKNNYNINTKDIIHDVKDDIYMHIDDEYAQIRQARSMYIGKGGTDGAMQIFREVLNNAIDEVNNENSIGDGNIYVTFDEPQCMFIVSDTSRGIPHDILLEIITKKHFSTKFTGMAENRQRGSTGMNGVGLKVTAALSDYMSITSLRGKKSKTIEVVNGDIHEHEVVKLSKHATGTRIMFSPSREYLGAIDITTDLVEDFFRNMSYLITPKITLNLTVYGIDGTQFTKVYKPLGLAEAVNYLTSSPEIPVIEAKLNTEMFDLAIAFTYDKNTENTLIASYANYVVTTEGGTHETLTQRAICDFLVKEGKKQEPNSKFEILFDDCKRGLVFAVNMEHDAPDLEGQHKSKVANKDILEFRKDLTNVIHNTLHNNQSNLKKIITYLRLVAKARLEANKIRGIATKKQTSFLDDSDMKCFFPVTDRNSTGYTELFITEGDSAGGAILNSREKQYQAVFTVTGVTDNVYGCTVADIIKKPIYRDLVRVLGCGIGSDFDIAKLKYNKIIIATDSDVDGKNIASLILNFFLNFLPELIHQGKIYKAMAPLYLLDQKKLSRHYKGDAWLYDKNELYHLKSKIIADNMEVVVCNETGEITNNVMTKAELLRWLNMNAEYTLELKNFGKRSFAQNTAVLENMLYFIILHTHSKDPKKSVKKAIESIYKELNFDTVTDTLSGSINRESCTLICDRIFIRNGARFAKQLMHNETPYIMYRNTKNKDDVWTLCTIGEFFDTMDKLFDIVIEQRFKGLGEANSILLFHTTLNPKFRKLLRITIDNIQECADVFALLHAKGNSFREARRELIDSAEISYADIDN